jgi:acetate CoA/acetoacetate CoA-transferase alpha subunit
MQKGNIMKTKLITLQDAASFFRDGMTIMVGGFMGVGTPPRLVEALLESGVRDLTLIANDTAFVDTGIGPLIVNGRVSKVIASHIGTNPETGRRMIAGEMDVQLVPQGTLIEQIRCGGAGLGGFLTPTGVGTIVEDGKQTITLEGKTWLLERPLRADLALIRAHRSDMLGNLTYQLSARNFNPLIALAADITLVEPDEMVETGELQPDQIVTPGAVIDHIVIPQES